MKFIILMQTWNSCLVDIIYESMATIFAIYYFDVSIARGWHGRWLILANTACSARQKLKFQECWCTFPFISIRMMMMLINGIALLFDAARQIPQHSHADTKSQNAFIQKSKKQMNALLVVLASAVYFDITSAIYSFWMLFAVVACALSSPPYTYIVSSLFFVRFVYLVFRVPSKSCP